MKFDLENSLLWTLGLLIIAMSFALVVMMGYGIYRTLSGYGKPTPLHIYVDPQTGQEYLSTGSRGGLVKRETPKQN